MFINLHGYVYVSNLRLIWIYVVCSCFEVGQVHLNLKYVCEMSFEDLVLYFYACIILILKNLKNDVINIL